MSELGPESAASSGTATQPDGEAETMAGPGAVTEDPEKLIRGARVGHFEIERLLGRGGMGVVYAAHDTKLDRRVAIKFVLGSFAGSAGSDRRARLDREARALARLSNPNVVQVFEIGEHQGQLYIVMEFVDGTTLSHSLEAIPEGPGRWREVVALLLPAGEGLMAAHEAGLVHRDFKPDNVLVERGGRVRVMDFGVAYSEATLALADLDMGMASTAANLALTQTGALVGTPAYMSPEQFRGARVDARSDQFAYCVVLYEALFSRRPFAGATVAELLAKVLEGPDPSFEGAKVPIPVVAALRRGLSRAPEERFGDMNELLEVLRGALAQPVPERRAATRSLGTFLSLAVGGAMLWVVVSGSEEAETDAAKASGSQRPQPAPVEGAQPAHPQPVDEAEGSAPTTVPDKSEQTRPDGPAVAEFGGPGSLPKEEIREVVRSNIDDVRACYNATLAKDPEASGRVLISALIGEAGNVESAKVTESELPDPFLGSCIAGKMMNWRFPAPEGGPVGITYPFILGPNDE